MDTQINSEERSLLLLLKEGDENAFKRLFETYSKRLYFVAYQYLNDQQDCEEVVQEVFLKLWLNRKNIDPELPLIPYLIRIAKNMLINQSKRKIIQNTYLQSLTSNSTSLTVSTEQQLYFSEVKQLVNQQLDKFPPKRKAIFVMSRMHGLSTREIAQKLEISERTVESQIYKALKSLRKHFSSSGYLTITIILLSFSHSNFL